MLAVSEPIPVDGRKNCIATGRALFSFRRSAPTQVRPQEHVQSQCQQDWSVSRVEFIAHGSRTAPHGRLVGPGVSLQAWMLLSRLPFKALIAVFKVQPAGVLGCFDHCSSKSTPCNFCNSDQQRLQRRAIPNDGWRSTSDFAAVARLIFRFSDGMMRPMLYQQ